MGALAAAHVTRFLGGRELNPSSRRQPVLIAFGDLQTYLVAGRSVVASKAWAARRKASTRYHGADGARQRADLVAAPRPAGCGRAWRQLALPQLLSLADFRKLPDFRAIRLL